MENSIATTEDLENKIVYVIANETHFKAFVEKDGVTMSTPILQRAIMGPIGNPYSHFGPQIQELFNVDKFDCSFVISECVSPLK